MSWEPLTQAFLEELKMRQKRRTLELCAFWLKAFRRFCEERSLTPETLGPWDVEAFQRHLVWTPGPRGGLYAPNTVDMAMRMLRTFLRWAAAHRHLPINPVQGLVLRDPPCRPVPKLNADELSRLLQFAHAASPRGWRDRAILEMLAGTSLPTAELVRLNLEHLELAQGTLRTTGGRTPSRTVALGASLVEALERYLRWGRPCLYNADAQALFLTQIGRRLEPKAVTSMVQAYARRAGLGRVTARTLAHAGRALAEEFQRRHLPEEMR